MRQEFTHGRHPVVGWAILDDLAPVPRGCFRKPRRWIGRWGWWWVIRPPPVFGSYRFSGFTRHSCTFSRSLHHFDFHRGSKNRPTRGFREHRSTFLHSPPGTRACSDPTIVLGPGRQPDGRTKTDRHQGVFIRFQRQPFKLLPQSQDFVPYRQLLARARAQYAPGGSAAVGPFLACIGNICSS
jgi:hypothetical protein